MKIRVLIATLLVLDAAQASMSGMKKHHHHHHRRAASAATLVQLEQQQNFYKHRNMLNEEEHENLQMFDSLTSKLTDEQFIDQAIANNKKLEDSQNLQIKGPEGRPDTLNFDMFRMPPEPPAPQSKAGPIVANGTSKSVKQSVTRTSSSSSSSSISSSSSSTTTIVTRNTSSYGGYQLTSGFEGVKCAGEGEVCNCLGQVHFGPKADSFMAMHQSNKNVSVLDTRNQGRNGYVSCDAAKFNVTSTGGGHECYCVREMAPEPLPKADHCADDKGFNFCPCYGTVYFGKKFEKKGETAALSFGQMMKSGWTSVLSNGDLLCAAESFDGDPAYGHDKQCFCEADPVYEPAPPVEQCGLEKDHTDCVCQGTVYYGRRHCMYEADEVIGFMEMLDQGYVSRKVDGAIGCNNFEFGDPAHGVEKQCFCEADMEPQVKRCATQDGQCYCGGGNVFYGVVDADGVSPASFEDMYQYSFAVKYDVQGTVSCDKHTFGFDPQPGKAKQCFCDDIQYEDKECIETELAYWSEQREIERIQWQSEVQWTETQTTYSTTTTVQEETQRRIAEEEELFAKETEVRLRKEEEERAKIQADLDQQDKINHDSEIALDAEAHKLEMEAAEAGNAEHEAEAAAENARKAAEQADDAAKFALQIEAKKAAAELADKKRDMEFKQKKADAEAARAKKQKMKKELKEKNRLQQLELTTIREARQAQLRAEKQKARLESQRLLQEFEANRAATEAARTQAAIQKALEEAMEKQMKLAIKRANDRQKEREEEAEKREKEEKRKQALAEKEAERQKKIEEAKEKELERLKKLEEAENARKDAVEKARKEEEARIKAAQQEQLKKQRELEQQQLRALRAQAIASTEADIKEAQELADKLAEEMEVSRKERQRLLDQKRDLAVQKEQAKAQHDQLLADKAKAQKELDSAKALLLKKKEQAEKLRKQTNEFIQKMKDQSAKAKAASEAQIKKEQAQADDARAKREAAAKASREADEKEHQAELKARRELDKLQQDQHQKEMDERKAEFEKTFRHLWGPGAVGLSVVYATFEDLETADKVIAATFKDTMIAQVTRTPEVTYTFKNETKLHLTNTGLHVQQNDARVEMITSDDRVPELIETAIAVSGNENLDIIVVQMNNIGPDYKKWVSLQTIEQDQTNAYYNMNAFNGDKPIAEKRVAKMGDYQNRPNQD